MKSRADQFSYLRARVEGATSVGMVIMLYDRLILDLQRTIAAMREGNIEERCAQAKHALLILQQLEGSLDSSQAPEAARNLGAFYAHARAKVMEAQIAGKPELLEKLITYFADVRGAWQQVDPARPQAIESYSRPEETGSVTTDEAMLSCTI